MLAQLNAAGLIDWSRAAVDRRDGLPGVVMPTGLIPRSTGSSQKAPRRYRQAGDYHENQG
ncbi:hypothetical protein GCM10009676_13520 [Prauserella halophila]|uniref:Uncharacterized protein n=1 Tax=Prauserella halophila TaxID=185641 RepID=A0ABN1W529_9PSEU